MARSNALIFMHFHVVLFGNKHEISHSTELRGGVCQSSSKAARREDLQIEQPILCWDFSSFYFYPTLTRMLGATLIRDQVVQVREPRQKRLLAATWVMKPFHREQFPVNRVMRLIQERTRHGHLRVCEHRIPAGFLVLKPLAHPVAVGLPCGVGDMVGKAA